LIADESGLESNVRFLRPYDEVVATWRRCIAHAYDPERLFARFTHQVDATYVNRMITPARGKLTIPNLRAALVLAFNIVLRVGLSPAVLARRVPRVPPWPDRRSARHRLRRLSLDRVLTRGAAWRPERLVLFDASARADARHRAATQVGVNS
jgi:hypothetical protein